MSFAQPLIPDNGSYADCNVGKYDGDVLAIATKLRDRGWGDAYLRLGYEMNGNWFYWGVNAASDAGPFRDCFRRQARIFKEVSSAFFIEWNPSANFSKGLPVQMLYPGDDVVDGIAVDTYDGFPAVRNENDWRTKCFETKESSPEGLCAYAAFARAHKKRLSVPEWGINVSRDSGGFDNPFFIAKMYQFFVENRELLEYEAYFDLQGGQFELSTGVNPRAAGEYQRLYRR